MTRIIDSDPQRVARWVADRVGGGCVGVTAAVGIEKNGVLVGGVLYDNYNGAVIGMHAAGEGKHWLTREFLWFVFYYPFIQLGVHKVLGLVPSTNRFISFHKNIGFTEEYRIKGGCKGGDLIILSMTKDQCKFLDWNRNVQTRYSRAA